MKTLRGLSNRNLDRLQDRLQEKLARADQRVMYKAARSRIMAKLWKIGNERLRRIGL